MGDVDAVDVSCRAPARRDGTLADSGLAIGVCVVLQLLSCVYYGVFLATMLAVACPLVLLVDVSPGPQAAGCCSALGLAAIHRRS